MRSVVTLPVFGLLLACSPTTTEPTQAPADPAAAPDLTEPPVQDEPAPGTDVDAVEADAPTEPTAGGDSPTDLAAAPADGGGEDPPATTDDPPEADPAPATRGSASATLELPRPVHGETNDKCGKDPGVGEPLKAFNLATPDGKQITKSTYRGRVLLVNFWGTWCKPCLKELPEFSQLYRRYRKFGLTLLAIATDDDGQAVTDTLASKKVAAKVAIGGEDYAGQYGSPKFPFTFVVDHKGIIRASYRGYRPECMGQLEADLREQMQVRADAKARRKRG